MLGGPGDSGAADKANRMQKPLGRVKRGRAALFPGANCHSAEVRFGRAQF